MKKLVFENEKAAGEYAAAAIKDVLQEKKDAVFCLAAGHSSLPVFSAIQEAGLDFSEARFIELDEWMDVPAAAEGSCTWFLNTHLFSKVNARPENIYMFDNTAPDLQAECSRMESKIEELGGIDYLLLGMGMNGHLALNEPGDSFENGVHVIELAPKTLEVAQKYFAAGMPAITGGLTLGIKNLLAARKIQLSVFGKHKHDVVCRLLSGQTPNEAFSASALYQAEGVELLLDKAAESGI